ncbi:MAG: hypothetical protein K0S74_1207 [Chlamydiales bacterium]|jgi:uncharacterized alkaline shock family protein YloU|nr:hypothetical protein [Chlamydiales bacterium]
METHKLDPKEFELPDTVVVRDIEDRVFQSIVLQCLARIEGISLVEGNFIDQIRFLGRGQTERVHGIIVEQESRTRSVNIKVEVNIYYGVEIPSKSDEIQTKIIEEITHLTGLHVACVHVIFKNLVLSDLDKKIIESQTSTQSKPLPALIGKDVYEDYSDEF